MARWKRPLVITGLIVGCLILAVGTLLVVVLNDFSCDTYAFLEGRKPNWRVLSGPGGSHSPLESRYYSWDGDFTTVRNRIESELEPLGFKRTVTKDGLVGWLKSSTAVWLQRGRSRSLKAALKGPIAADGTGVTIACINDAPDDWRIHIRLAFQPRY